MSGWIRLGQVSTG